MIVTKEVIQMIIRSFSLMECKSYSLRILSRPAVVADGDGSRVEITNLEMWLSIPVDVKVSGFLDMDLLKSSGEFGLSVLPFEGDAYDDYPHAPEGSKANQTYPADLFTDIDERVMRVVSVDSTRGSLQCVLFDAEQSVMVATDGHRLITSPLAHGKSDNKLPADVLFNIPTLSLLIAARGRGWRLAGVDQIDGWFLFTWANGAKLYTKKIEGPYPAYHKVIPTPKHLIHLTRDERAQFIAAVKAVSPAANPLTHLVALGKDGVAYAYNSVAWRSPLPFSTPFDVGFNAVFLLDMLEGMPEGDLTIGFSSEIGGCIFSTDKHPSINKGIQMLMPLRIIGDGKPEAKTFVTVEPRVPEVKGLQRLATFRKTMKKRQGR